MEIQKLILIRDFLFKTFIVGLVFAIFMFVMTVALWDRWTGFIYAKFHIPYEELGKLVFGFFLDLRLYLVFVVLVPAIALHWLIKSQKT